MKFRRSFSLMLAYLLLMTMLPMNFLVQQVKAYDSKWIESCDVDGKNQCLNYQYNNLFNYIGDYGSVTTYREGNITFLFSEGKIIRVNSDGTIKIVKDNPKEAYTNIEDYFDSCTKFQNGYICSEGGKAYFYNYDLNGGTISSIDLYTGAEQKIYDVQIPEGYGITDVRATAGKNVGKGGTIVLKCFTKISEFTCNGFFIKIKDGKQSLIDLRGTGVEFITRFAIDSKENIWLNCIGDTPIFKVDDNNNIEKFSVKLDGDSLNPFNEFYIDKEDNIWTRTMGNNFVKISQSENGLIAKKYFNSPEPVEICTDDDGQVWVSNSYSLMKLENDKLVTKYMIYGWGQNISDWNRSSISVIDDYHLIVLKNTSYIYINNESAKYRKPVPVDVSEATVDIKTERIKNSDGSVLIKVHESNIDSDAINVIEFANLMDASVIETRINVAAIRDGRGKLQFKGPGVEVLLPIRAIDFTGVGEGAYLSFKEVLNNDDVLTTSKGVKKVFQFEVAIYDKDGKKIKDIHQFSNENKAKVSITLTDKELEGIDISKLAAFNYNEEAGIVENLGGIYEKQSKTFTFVTPHFSKFILGEVDVFNGILPQTGSSNDIVSLMSLGAIMIITGFVLIARKKVKVK